MNRINMNRGIFKEDPLSSTKEKVLVRSSTLEAFYNSKCSQLHIPKPVLEKANKSVYDFVSEVISDIGEKLALSDLGDVTFTTHLEPIGSSAEGTKIDKPDEFDFLVVLQLPEHIRCCISQKEYQSTTGDYKPKSYCEAFLKDERTGTGIHLNPREMGDTFEQLLEEKGHKVESNGPAKTIYVSSNKLKITSGGIEKNISEFEIKIDLTLAYEVDLQQTRDCLHDAGAELFLPYGNKNDSNFHMYHIIASGDYWKLSCAVAERNFITRQTVVDVNLLRRMKIIFHHYSEMGQQQTKHQTSSYPLKVAFIHRLNWWNYQQDDSMASTQQLDTFENALLIMRYASSAELPSYKTSTRKSFFFRGDPITKETASDCVHFAEAADSFSKEMHDLCKKVFWRGAILALYLSFICVIFDCILTQTEYVPYIISMFMLLMVPFVICYLRFCWIYIKSHVEVFPMIVLHDGFVIVMFSQAMICKYVSMDKPRFAHPAHDEFFIVCIAIIMVLMMAFIGSFIATFIFYKIMVCALIAVRKQMPNKFQRIIVSRHEAEYLAGVDFYYTAHLLIFDVICMFGIRMRKCCSQCWRRFGRAVLRSHRGYRPILPLETPDDGRIV